MWAMLKGKVARSNLMFKKDTDTASDCGSTDDERTPTASEGHEASVMLKDTIQQQKTQKKSKQTNNTQEIIKKHMKIYIPKK